MAKENTNAQLENQILKRFFGINQADIFRIFFNPLSSPPTFLRLRWRQFRLVQQKWSIAITYNIHCTILGSFTTGGWLSLLSLFFITLFIWLQILKSLFLSSKWLSEYLYATWSHTWTWGAFSNTSSNPGTAIKPSKKIAVGSSSSNVCLIQPLKQRKRTYCSEIHLGSAVLLVIKH